MEFNWVEWFGYFASLIVLISLTMSSIIKLRVLNLIGCLLFASFAYFIDSVPTMFMNLSIVCINFYYLYQMYSHKEEFKIISASLDSEYFDHFITVNKQEIEKNTSIENLKKVEQAFYMLRNNNTAGVLAGNIERDGIFTIVLDYVTPQYRDFKLGSYYFKKYPAFLKEKGINTLQAFANSKEHHNYLQKMGFLPSTRNNNIYLKQL
ncbi:hypothetical protein [Psychromonas sp. MME2]|uniref:hypothetical protein n=1 Tax=unclassified Psychromonas TaxID=2614957 RepID=UPI00339CD17C